MTETGFVHDALCDDELIAEVKRLAGCEHQATARLIAALAELDSRRLYLGQGCVSMFTHCTQVLHLAEHAAYNRIEAARAARRFPVILTRLADGSIHLSAIRLLAPHLTQENHADVLREASHKSKRDVEQIVARLQPRPDVVASVRKLPAVRTMPAPVVPYAAGGATTADNLELRCAAHNRYEAEQYFGSMVVREERGLGIWSDAATRSGRVRGPSRVGMGSSQSLASCSHAVCAMWRTRGTHRSGLMTSGSEVGAPAA